MISCLCGAEKKKPPKHIRTRWKAQDVFYLVHQDLAKDKDQKQMSNTEDINE